MKRCMHEVNRHIEGTVTQIFLIGPSFCFMKSRKKSLKNTLKVSHLFNRWPKKKSEKKKIKIYISIN